MSENKEQESWTHIKLRDVSIIIMGQSPSSETYNQDQSGLPFLQGCADFGAVYPKVKNYCSLPLKVAPSNSILISVRAPVGEINYSDKSYCIGRGLAAITSDDTNIINYLYYYLILFRDKFKKLSQGSTFEAINSETLRNFELIMPTDDQRKVVVEILSTIDSTIEKTEALIEKYQKIKEGMMQDLFTRGIGKDGKLRPSYHEAPELYKETELGMVPKEWKLQKIVDSEVEIIDGDRGVNYPKNYELLSDGYCLFLNASNVTKDGFVFDKLHFITKDKEDLLGTGKLILNDVIITTGGTVGNIAFYDHSVLYDNVRINSGMIILRNREKALKSKYLYYSLKNYIFQVEYKRVVSGSAQPQLPIKDLKQFCILIPSVIEQDGICTLVEGIDETIKSEFQLLHKLQQLKQALMQNLLTGKVRVTA